MLVRPWRHSPVRFLHKYPEGQQCCLSLQQKAFGTAQHPHCPEINLQHVLPLGQLLLESHFTIPKGPVLETADSLDSHGITVDPSLHPLAVQVEPCAQQWRWSLQQLAFGIGQHPRFPEPNPQHVLRLGQLWLESHLTLPQGSTCVSADSLDCHGMLNSPLEHLDELDAHLYPDGQQCWWSLQQTAFDIGQHPHVLSEILQHVLPLGHVLLESHRTLSTGDNRIYAGCLDNHGIVDRPTAHFD